MNGIPAFQGNVMASSRTVKVLKTFLGYLDPMLPYNTEIHFSINTVLYPRRREYSIIPDNDQLDTHLLYFSIRLLYSSTCFEL